MIEEDSLWICIWFIFYNRWYFWIWSL